MFSLRLLATICLSLISAYFVYGVQVQTFGHLFHPPAGEEHHHKEEKQDLNKIPGVPGVDYPVYHEVPHTSFSCAHVPAVPGMYANLETGCQAYHVCHDGREGHQGASFLCTNGTIFNQKEFACDWWYNVKCEEAANYYHLNADPEHNPYTPKKKLIEEEHLAPLDPHGHGNGFLIHA
uniref:Chitin-binding type-2 domain-containing protein n=2 Tax=Stomoxys calcitrans TaxID=35570 RepID=A0A1I8P2X9_STOCA